MIFSPFRLLIIATKYLWTWIDILNNTDWLKNGPAGEKGLKMGCKFVSSQVRLMSRSWIFQPDICTQLNNLNEYPWDSLK